MKDSRYIMFMKKYYSNSRRWFSEICAKLMMFETIIIIEKGKGVNIIYVYAWDSLRERTGIFFEQAKKRKLNSQLLVKSTNFF